MYGYVFLTAMGVTYAAYEVFSLGDMAYVELPISENANPLGYVIEVSGLGYNYKQHFQVEPMPLTDGRPVHGRPTGRPRAAEPGPAG